MRLGLWPALLLSLLSGCSSVPTTYHPVQPLDPRRVTHDLFDEVLHSYVADGWVAYHMVGQDGRFYDYLQQLDRIEPSALPGFADRLAFWINAYNAFAIKGIVDGYSPATLWGRYRYFIARQYQVGGERINLYDLERDVLIPLQEPRIHFAIVCASRSCPKLQSRVYRGDRLDEQLEAATRSFVNDPSRNRFDRERRIAYLSKIFDWFSEDFAAAAGSVQRFVGRYIEDPDLAQDIAAVPYVVKYLEYDWRLNGVPPRQADHADSSS